MNNASRYVEQLPFPPDAFQKDAAAAIDDGESVVVTAPTGAGKTVVGEAAIANALGRGARAFYTTPIKALSNQKYVDLRAVHGPANVGLLTGDNSINGDAPIVVMTTEVLRNMIYAESPDLDELAVVILDEVHYLQDRARGGVWEEVIIHLPGTVQLVCLSATIANPTDFTDWVASRRGPTRLVVESTRPVPLESWFMAADASQGGMLFEPMFVSGRPNSRLERLLRPTRNRRKRFSPPRRGDVVEYLAEIDRLPAIYFVFSRNGCESAAERVAAAVSLTTAAEASQIREVALQRTRHLTDGDLDVLGYSFFVDRLQRGIAAHHAGMVPAFKETVEELFVKGLVKVVFATETLALGINMPARTVVIESLSKFTGDGHELLQPGDFTQLTGRAGRRGIDTAGTAVVLHSSFVSLARMTAIAAAGTHPLRSSFRPTYNMVVNLVAGYDQAQATELLQASFGQYSGQRQQAELEERASDLKAELAAARRGAACELGDITPYVDSGSSAAHSSLMRRFAFELVPGDVVESSKGRLLVLAKGTGSNPKLLVLTTAGKAERVRPNSLEPSSVRVGTLQLPEPFAPRQEEYRAEASDRLRRFQATGSPDLSARPADADPVLACPDLNAHIEAARLVRRLEREAARVGGRLQQAESDLVTTFRSLLQLLEEKGFVAGWSLLPRGDRLRFMYNELDLRIVEAMDEGHFEDLEDAELAALASMFVYEPRPADYQRPIPTRRLQLRFDEITRLDRALAAEETKRHLPNPRPPAEGFAGAIYAWADGDDLGSVLGEDEAAGDLVRNSRQVIDLLRQLGDAFEHLAAQTNRAIALVDKGVVAAGGLE